MPIGARGEVIPARKESCLVMIKLKPRARRKKKTGTQEAAKGFLSALWKHVAVLESLMAAHTHDVRLIVRREISNIARE